MSTQKTLKIDPNLFKFGSKKKSKDRTTKVRPIVDRAQAVQANRVKKELLSKVKDHQKRTEQEKLKDERRENSENLFEKHEFENSDFERKFNDSLDFLQKLANKNKEKKKKHRNEQHQHTLKHSKISYGYDSDPNLEVNLNLPTDLKACHNSSRSNEPSYGCLKNGNKPTFRQFNKTQKIGCNSVTPKKIQIVLETDQSPLPRATPTPRATPIQATPIQAAPTPAPKSPITQVALDEPSPTTISAQIASYPKKQTMFANVLENKTKTLESLDDNLSKQSTNQSGHSMDSIKISKMDDQDKNIPKITRITKTYKYNLGRKKGAKHVGLLVKNRDTVKKIKQEVGLLKKKNIVEVKNYLREKNLMKAGSQAPHDVLRQLYECSVLSGDVKNENGDNLVHNFLHNE